MFSRSNEYPKYFTITISQSHNGVFSEGSVSFKFLRCSLYFVSFRIYMDDVWSSWIPFKQWGGNFFIEDGFPNSSHDLILGVKYRRLSGLSDRVGFEIIKNSFFELIQYPDRTFDAEGVANITFVFAESLRFRSVYKVLAENQGAKFTTGTNINLKCVLKWADRSTELLIHSFKPEEAIKSIDETHRDVNLITPSRHVRFEDVPEMGDNTYVRVRKM
ncbi:uncharacterized protein LOC126686347 [Mercurialis annua]|uniref:uncharacterized protein LOC126686347 n=1 Tax=Mercurialis annua TaxID=3986 RepID=UPI00215F656F|nr:uncharacterized protein LOC126686347 [Mercurialis annua]